MQSVILAGGLGTRLRPITEAIPKPMVPVAGLPYLEHQVRLLVKQGFHEILLLTGYLGEQIEDYFGNGGNFGASIQYSKEPRPLGTGGALRQANDLLDQEFLLLYGDSLLPIQYSDIANRLSLPGSEGVTAIFHDTNGITSVPPNIKVGPDERVIRYDKKSPNDPDLTHIDAGVLALRKTILYELPMDTEVVSLEDIVFPRLIARRSLYAYSTTQRFYDIGTPERLRVLEDYLRWL